MSEWFISCHGGQPSTAGLFKGPGEKKIIPGRMKIYFYVREGQQLSMDGGWNLWSTLMYGARGGVNAAKREAIYVKDRTQFCYDYEFGVGSGETWEDTDTAHHKIDTVGIFEVGVYTPPKAKPVPVGPRIPTFPNILRLSAVITAATAAGVEAIHVGTCRVDSTGGIVLTPRWLL